MKWRNFTGGIKKKEMRKFYRQFINKGDMVFDIGANIGNRTDIFIELGATVIAVEPQSSCARILKTKYGKNNRFILINKALAEKEGQAEMMISDASTISSLSKDWVDAVRKSGRFGNHKWDGKETVQTTTLDKLIEEYGVPSFIKIDVEGYEYEVLRGLTKPVNVISFEFTPECLESAFNCLNYLSKLGAVVMNYSVGESMKWSLDKWVSPIEIIKILSEFENDNKLFGDIYAKFKR